jgi:hypothetical protein
MLNVDWSVASDWGVERRYTPVGGRSVEQVTAQIRETEKVCTELCHYEVLERLREIEIAASRERGPFNFFSFIWNPQYHWWEVLAAFWALDDKERADREEHIDDLINCHLDAQLQSFICSLRFLHPADEELKSFYAFFGMFGGPVQHALRTMARDNVVTGLPPMPPAWIVTCANWAEDSVVAHIRSVAERSAS